MTPVAVEMIVLVIRDERYATGKPNTDWPGFWT